LLAEMLVEVTSYSPPARRRRPRTCSTFICRWCARGAAASGWRCERKRCQAWCDQGPRQRAPGSSLQRDGHVQSSKPEGGLERRSPPPGASQSRGGVGRGRYDLIVRTRQDRSRGRTAEGGSPSRMVASRHRAGIKGTAAREIDAGGKFVLPGARQATSCWSNARASHHVRRRFLHRHGVGRGRRPPTLIPFAAQHRGMSRRQVVTIIHEAATPQGGLIDYAFHLLIHRPDAAGAGPGAAGADQADGYFRSRST